MSQQDSSTGQRRIVRIINERGTPPTEDPVPGTDEKRGKTPAKPKQNSNQKPRQPNDMSDGTLP